MSEFKKSGWKYGLIKTSVEYEGTEFEEQVNRLVELYPDENGNYAAFCEARLMSIEEIEAALNDIKSDGINEHFFDNGRFTWETCENCYTQDIDWEPTNKTLGTAVIKENKKGEPYLNLTSDVLSQMGWAGGDGIELDCNADGTFTLTKISQKMPMTAWAGENDDIDAELYAVYGGD
jgi:hypothetical protein